MTEFCLVPGENCVSVMLCFSSMATDVTTLQTELLLRSGVPP